MPFYCDTFLPVADWRRSLGFHRAVGFTCQGPEDDEADTLVVRQNHWTVSWISAGCAPPGLAGRGTVRVAAAGSEARAFFERAIAAGARPTGPLQYEDPDGHTWIFQEEVRW